MALLVATGHSQAEVAERLGVPPAGVKAALERARRASARLDPALREHF